LGEPPIVPVDDVREWLSGGAPRDAREDAG